VRDHVYLIVVKRIYFQLYFLLLLNCCFAQESYFRHFGVEQGLPSSEVYDILQDRNGFIWMATDRGVSRYDSYSFHNFSSADGLTDNTVFILTEDTTGNIWCGTLNSKLCYFSGEKIIPYKYNMLLATQSRSNTLMQSMTVTGAGDVVIGYQHDGSFVINQAGKFTNLNDSKKNANINHEVNVTGSYLIFGSSTNKSLPVPNKNSSLHVDLNGKILDIALPVTPPSHYVTALRKKDGTLLIGTGNNIVEVFADCTYKLHTFPSQVMHLNEDAYGNCWVSISGLGVRQYPPAADLSGNNYNSFLINETVTDVMQDKEGGYWMSTLGHGVFYLVSPWVHCLFPVNNTKGISATTVISKNNGQILLGTSNGLLYTCTNGKITSTFNCNSTSGYTDFVQDICVTPGGNDIWVGTNKELMCIGPNDKVDRITNNGFARTISGDGAGGEWFGGTRRIIHIKQHEHTPDRVVIPDCRIEELFWDSITGKLLLGRIDGLYWLNGDNPERYFLPGGELTARVNAIKRTTKNVLAIATIGEGICVIKDNRRIMIGAKQGLCSPIVNDIDVDKNGDLWAATNAGIAHIHWTADTFSVNCFSIFHGLPTNEIRKIFCSNDTVWIGTNNGAAWFIPGELKRTSIAPPIFIQEVLVNGKRTNHDVNGNFSFDQDQVRISFLGISYGNGGNTTYRYRLTGLENNWTYTSNRSVEYASLPAGNYRFEVMAKNGDGTWSASAAAFSFTIRQPFWYMWWFWTILIIVFAGSGAWIVTRRLKNIRKDAMQKGLLAEYQHQALAAQMNPHFIFNSLSSMQAFVLGDEKENALRYIDRFSFLMRKSLEHSMLKFVPLEKEIELLRAYLDIEAMRFGDKLTYTIACEAPLDISSTEVPTMVVQPFVENAIRHGLLHREEPGGKILISFTLKGNEVWCRVEDNGVGRKRSTEINRTRRKHVSFGSSITEERLRLLCNVTGQSCSITYTDKTAEDNHPAGTIVYFMLPSRKREQYAESPAH
jgi:ligand-binding sensor domain-containing protein/anti-sigma regulatory factor (Ser/Thr protein kinase)